RARCAAQRAAWSCAVRFTWDQKYAPFCCPMKKRKRDPKNFPYFAETAPYDESHTALFCLFPQKNRHDERLYGNANCGERLLSEKKTRQKKKGRDDRGRKAATAGKQHDSAAFGGNCPSRSPGHARRNRPHSGKNASKDPAAGFFRRAVYGQFRDRADF